MKIAGLLIISFLFTLSAFADDIYFKSGYMLKNVWVKDTTGIYINVVLSNDTRTFLLNTIKSIEKSQFDPSKLSLYGRIDDMEYGMGTKDLPLSNTTKTYPNLKYLPLSLLAFGMAWDYFDAASAIDDDLSLYKMINQNHIFDAAIDELEGRQTRKTILGIAFAAAGIVNIWICAQSVEVTATPNKVTVSYNF